MCDNFFDVRTFGAVMCTGINCGQVRGPVQFSFARSIEPIVPLEISITRMAATNEKEKAEREKGEGDERTENRTMGRKHIVPYGLYRAHGFVSAKLAERTGFGAGRTSSFVCEALATCSSTTARRRAARWRRASCIVFKHASRARQRAGARAVRPRHGRSGAVGDETYTRSAIRASTICRRPGASPTIAVTIDRDGLPEGVEIIELV